MSDFITGGLGLLAGVSLLVLFSGYAVLTYKLWVPRAQLDAGFGISVLKPVKGTDEGLLENLRAIARQNYPEFEMIVGAEDASDPALDVARRVQAEFPHVRIVVVVGAFPSGLNPKVRLLRQMLPVARHQWVLISDSNVRPDPEYMRAMAAQQVRHQADLVHSLLMGSGGTGLGGRLEELQLNGWVAASISLSDALGHSCAIGKSMLINQKALTAVGGFERVADVLAEDYTLGALLQETNHRVVVSPHLLLVITGRTSLRQFLNRHIRWAQMRRHIAPGFYVLELTGYPILFLSGLWLMQGVAWMGPPSISGESGTALSQLLLVLASSWLPWVLLLKWTVDAFVYMALAVRPSFGTLVLLPVKDALMPVVWLLGALRRTVNWRGQRLWVSAGSRLSLAPTSRKGGSEGGRWATPAA